MDYIPKHHKLEDELVHEEENDHLHSVDENMHHHGA